jgi:hypothetical protein
MIREFDAERSSHQTAPSAIHSGMLPYILEKRLNRRLRRDSRTVVDPENTNGRLRDECLNVQLFFTVADARDKLERWRQDYNRIRPHSALGDSAPEEFVEGWQATAIETAQVIASLVLRVSGQRRWPSRRGPRLPTSQLPTLFKF